MLENRPVPTECQDDSYSLQHPTPEQVLDAQEGRGEEECVDIIGICSGILSAGGRSIIDTVERVEALPIDGSGGATGILGDGKTSKEYLPGLRPGPKK